MALGSVEVTPLDLVTGYATFANGGYKIEPYLVSKIVKTVALFISTIQR